MEWLFALWFVFCMARDENYLATPKIDKPNVEPLYNDIDWRKANGLPMTDVEVDVIFVKYISQKAH